MIAARRPDPAHVLARYLSGAGHPFIVIPATVAAISGLRGGGARSAIGIAVAFLVVSAIIVAGIRRGRFNDFDVSERERRPRFYVLVTAVTVALGLWLRDQPQALRACVVAAMVLVACGLINRWLKASLHTTFSLYAAALWGAWSMSAGLAAVPLAGAVAWSRVRLGRHSPREVVAGAAVGLAAAALLLLMAQGPFAPLFPR